MVIQNNTSLDLICLDLYIMLDKGITGFHWRKFQSVASACQKVVLNFILESKG